eukprot:5983639-Lingulodinium_polyedra.AAC.1
MSGANLFEFRWVCTQLHEVSREASRLGRAAWQRRNAVFTEELEEALRRGQQSLAYTICCRLGGK